MSFPSLAAIRASYSLLMSGATEPLAAHLRSLIEHLYAQLQALDRRLATATAAASPPTPRSTHRQALFRIPPEMPQSPIFSVLSREPRGLARFCQRGGFVVRAIVAPTVPAGTERVRVCLHAGNSLAEVDSLVARMAEWVESQAGPAAGAAGAGQWAAPKL